MTVWRPRSRLALLCALSCQAAATSGCYTYHVYQAGGPNGREMGNQPAAEWQHKRVNAYLWGAIRQDLPIAGARNPADPTGGIEEIKIETNLGYALISVGTLGIWTPLDVSWRTSKPPAPASKLQ